MQVPSHLSPREYFARGIPSWLVIGNACVDVLAGESAAHARVSQASRHRVMSIEHKALFVRRRLLRVGLDSIKAAQESGEAGASARAGPPPPPPPPPIAIARFASAHYLTESGRACSVCRGSSTKAVLAEWLKSECFRLQHVNSQIARVPRGR
eukprot:5323134-Pyramimonas_sp.AAC.1